MLKNEIYYKVYNPSGLFNQVLSLEIAAGIHYKTNREIILYNVSKNIGDYPIFSANKYLDKYPELIQKNQNIKINDIFTWNGQDSFIIDDSINETTIDAKLVYDVQLMFLVDKGKTLSNVEQFGFKRSSFCIDNSSINFVNTLNFYSRFFYHRDKNFDKNIRSVLPKKEYINLSKKIANSLGKFNAIHLRLTDFVDNMYTVTEEMVKDALCEINNENKIVICTDDSDNDIIKNINTPFILLDEYIYNNFFNEFKSLPFSDNVIFGLINNLVLHYSEDFIGTQGSTYTAYIQRNRVLNGLKPSWKMFNDLNYKNKNTYSWIDYPIDELAKCWWREWEECILI